MCVKVHYSADSLVTAGRYIFIVNSFPDRQFVVTCPSNARIISNVFEISADDASPEFPEADDGLGKQDKA